MLTSQNDIEATGSSKGSKFNVFAYLVVAGGFLTQVLRLLGQRGFSFVIPDVQAALGVSTAEVGLIASWYGAMSALGAIVWGGISDRIGPRIVMTISGLLFSIGCFLFGWFASESLLVACACWTVAGFGASGLYMATVPKLIGAWFVPEKRGHAMRFITPGGSITGMVLGVVMPIGMSALGWQSIFVVFGVIALVFTAFFFFLIRDDPYERNTVPVGSPAGTQLAPPLKEDKAARKGAYLKAMKLPIVWRIGIMYVFYQFFWQANSTFYVANMRELYGPAEAGLGVTICSIVSIFGMLIWGPVSDRIGRKKTCLIAFAWCAVMAVILYFASANAPGLIVFYVLVAVMNITLSMAPVMLAMFADYFPDDINSTCNGIVSTLSAIGYYAAPFVAGLAIDGIGMMGGYYLVILAGAVITFVLTILLPKTKFEEKRAAKQ